MLPCALSYLRSLRQALDREQPGWVRETIWCPWHRVEHELTPYPGQRRLLPSADQNAAGTHSSGPSIRFLPGGLPCFHESSSDVLTAPCAYCGTTLHAHTDMLGTVKSGRHGAGYLEERCPACHRTNAVFPAYGNTAIRTTRLAGGEPAMQMKLN